jgi:hypothetical protein
MALAIKTQKKPNAASRLTIPPPFSPLVVFQKIEVAIFGH